MRWLFGRLNQVSVLNLGVDSGIDVFVNRPLNSITGSIRWTWSYAACIEYLARVATAMETHVSSVD